MKDPNGYDEVIFRYDLDAYGISVKDKNFKDANIFANRIMSNAVIFDEKEYGIVGYVLKEIANDGLNLLQSSNISEIPLFVRASSKIVGLVLNLLESKKIDLEQIWDAYNQHQNSTHKLFMSKTEKNSYLDQNTKFSKSAINTLIEYMRKNQKIFSYRPNNFIKGILNEVSRLSKVHGLDNDDEHFVSLFRMLLRLDEYVKENSTLSDFIPRSEKELIPFVEKIISLRNSQNDGNFKHDNINDLLWSMIKTWRHYFIKFLENPQPMYSVRQNQEAPENPEATELINEITKHIEEEAGLR